MQSVLVEAVLHAWADAGRQTDADVIEAAEQTGVELLRHTERKWKEVRKVKGRWKSGESGGEEWCECWRRSRVVRCDELVTCEAAMNASEQCR